MQLLSENQLHLSAVVANNRMNRKRQATGINSYEKEFKFKPEDFLEDCLRKNGKASWADICCGEGNALIQTAQTLQTKFGKHSIRLLGIDLVDAYSGIPEQLHCLHFQTCAVAEWQATEAFDLITCVHGLHYVGDKLKTIEKCCAALTTEGLFIANFDYETVKCHTNLKTLLKKSGLQYNSRTRILSCKGKKSVSFKLKFLGANDKAGPNYTGQEGVDSHYSV